MPERFAAGCFEDLDAVLRASADRERWWVARHAIEVLGRMLAGNDRPWVGEDSASRDRFDRIRDQLALRLRVGRQALARGLEHQDAEVRRAAWTWLRTVSGQQHAITDGQLEPAAGDGQAVGIRRIDLELNRGRRKQQERGDGGQGCRASQQSR